MDFTSRDLEIVALFDKEKDVKTLVEEYVHIQNQNDSDDAVMITDLGDVINKFRNWHSLLPRVTPFYAVKCNNDGMILKLMANLGLSFDCASKEEIRSILSLGVAPERIIYAHTCKQASMLTYAAEHHVITMTFDNEEELHKPNDFVQKHGKQCLVIRILPPGMFKVQMSFDEKFGCHIKDVQSLLKRAKTLNLNVVGVSFHVGSGSEDPKAYAVAIEAARKVVDKGRELGFSMNIVDIGGGLPGHSYWPIQFKEFANAINEALDQHFPTDTDEKVTIIAEPGTYFVASAMTLVANIIAKKVVTSDKDDRVPEEKRNGSGVLSNGVEKGEFKSFGEPPKIMYYINNGVYGVFGGWHLYNTTLPLYSLKSSKETYNSKIWGPTCDSIDSVNDSIDLPEHDIGEWLYFPDMGAYTVSCASGFNGMPQPKQKYVCQKQTWMTLYNNGLIKTP